MIKKMEAKYRFRAATMLLFYIHKIAVPEVSYFFKITELHSITRLLQVALVWL